MTEATAVPSSPPPPLEIEVAVIGALLYYPGAYESVCERLEPEHFVDPFLSAVYWWIEGEIGAGAVAGEVLQMACLRAVEDVHGGTKAVAHCIASACVPIELPYAVRLMIEYRESADGGSR